MIILISNLAVAAHGNGACLEKFTLQRIAVGRRLTEIRRSRKEPNADFQGLPGFAPIYDVQGAMALVPFPPAVHGKIVYQAYHRLSCNNIFFNLNVLSKQTINHCVIVLYIFLQWQATSPICITGQNALQEQLANVNVCMLGKDQQHRQHIQIADILLSNQVRADC